MDAVGFAGQQRFVDVDLARPGHGAVQQDLVARFDNEQVADHQIAGIDLDVLAVAHHPRGGPVEQRNAVQPPLGDRLLHDANGGIDDRESRRHQRVFWLPEQDQDETDAKERGVDKGKKVVLDDLPVGAAGFVLDVVAEAVRTARFHLRARQPKRGSRGIREELSRDGISNRSHCPSV